MQVQECEVREVEQCEFCAAELDPSKQCHIGRFRVCEECLEEHEVNQGAGVSEAFARGVLVGGVIMLVVFLLVAVIVFGRV